MRFNTLIKMRVIKMRGLKLKMPVCHAHAVPVAGCLSVFDACIHQFPGEQSGIRGTNAPSNNSISTMENTDET